MFEAMEDCWVEEQAARLPGWMGIADRLDQDRRTTKDVKPRV
jgi:hypothetical protein